LKLQTQWTFAGMGARVGIPDAAVDRRAALYGIEITEIHQDKIDECVSVVLKADADEYTKDSET